MSQFTDAQPSMLFLAMCAALMALTVSYSVDAVPLDAKNAPKSAAPGAIAPFELPTLAPSAIVLSGTPTFRKEEGIVKLFFAPSKTELPLNTEAVLQEIADAIQTGHRVQVSGFHDATGNAQQNMILSKKRAEVVQKKLIAMGAPASAIQIKKPALAVTTIDHAEARRVEVAFLN